MTVEIRESVSAKPVKKSSNRWRVVVAKPGEGSSGTYSDELFAKYGAVAFGNKPKGYFKHNSPQDRDPRDQFGFYENAEWNSNSRQLEADLVVYKHWVPVIEGIGSDLELSINVKGTKDEAGNITELFYDRTNSIDAVGYAGLEGSGVLEQLESLVETARSFDEKPSTNVVREKEETMEKEILEAIKSLNDAVVAFMNESKAKAEADAKVEADAKSADEAVATAVEAYDKGIALIDAHREQLTASQIESVRATAKNGGDVQPLIESFIKSNDEVKATLQETLVEGRSGGASSFAGVTAWGNN